MIDKLEMVNFQSHKNSTIEFGSGVNVIVGSSDSGKSAILRALLWVITNQPAGDGFRRHGTKETRVSLSIDGTTIDRIKSDSKNLYRIDGREHKAFGKGQVPPEIAEFLNFHDINFSKQMDPAFMLSNSPGEVARYLNQIVKLDTIDQSMSNITSWQRNNNRDIRETTERIDELKGDLKEFAYLRRMAKEVEKADTMASEAAKAETDARGLLSLINSSEAQESALFGINRLVSLCEKAEQIEKLEKELLKDKAFVIDLRHLIGKIEAHIRDIQRYEIEIAEYEEQIPELCPTCGAPINA
jgi:exonuclease SbcC